MPQTACLIDDSVPAPRPVTTRSLSLAPAGVGRLTFVDLARAFAVLMMIQGHTLDVLMPAEHRTSLGFYAWSSFRGLTSCLFMCLSGFVFTIATERRWHVYAESLPANLRRVRRLTLFLGLGYLLRFPAARIGDLPYLSREIWTHFLVVDVLQCIAVSLLLLHLLALTARTRARFAAAAGLLCLATVALTPAAWHGATGSLPIAVAAYVSPGTGSLFPLFPWSAYVFLGAALGHVSLRVGTHDLKRLANQMFLPAGVLSIAAAVTCARLPWEPLGVTDFWTTSPNQFFLRAGAVLVILGGAAHVSRIVTRPNLVVRSLAQESLVVYILHLCLVYGSVWNAGLLQVRGRTTTLVEAVGYVVLLWTLMALVAIGWYECKRRHVRLARWTMIGLAGALAFSLL